MATTNRLKVGAMQDGPSSFVMLDPIDGTSTVSITAASWDPTTVAALEGSVSGARWSPVRENGVPIVVSSNWIGIIEGNGSLRINVMSIGASVGVELETSGK
jgi:hypothetical protein